MRNQMPIWVPAVDWLVLGPIGKILFTTKHRPSTFALCLHNWGRNLQDWVENRYCNICYVKLKNGRCPNCWTKNGLNLCWKKESRQSRKQPPCSPLLRGNNPKNRCGILYRRKIILFLDIFLGFQDGANMLSSQTTTWFLIPLV